MRPLTELTDHLIEAFHEPVRQELPRLLRTASTLPCPSEAARAGAAIRERLTDLDSALRPHMVTEERELFPLLRRLDAGAGRPADHDRLRELVRTLQAEHAALDALVTALRDASGSCAAARTPCSTLRLLHRGLTELDELMRLQIHLEHHILFPRAEAMAEALLGRSR